ncbi:MAG: anaerobic ribonucleoside triphosphate reductase, partial [Selenomonadaceae bacterium]|nr:anaerobic ribonucleoside triphosphate reductase [Selenomonadaceae bacterium]
MKLKIVTKRSGSKVNYDREKIFNAIAGANRDASTENDKLSAEDVERVTNSVESAISEKNNIGVEEIQDQVEKSLMAHNFFDVAKQYIVYRQKHTQRREAQKKLMETYRDIFFTDSVKVDLKRDNANINTDASMGIMLKLGAEGAKHFVDNYVLPEEFRAADSENFIHIHDKDFSLITLNCCQIDLLKLFHGGFSTGHGFLREPQSIRSYASLACIAIQSNQNDMFGGQSINAFDYAMAEGVRKSFKKILKAELLRACEFCDVEPHGEIDFNICTYSEKENPAAVENLTSIVGSEKLAKKIYSQACKDVEEETHQAMEALIHNFNTLHSRAGAQVPFSSINYGMDTSPEGRLATREVLNAIEAGLGNGETPIFPISVFQLKAGVNYHIDDPNYDLFRQACKVSAKRLFPNFVNLDAPYNLQYYKPGDYNSYVATMGCRTRVMSNVNGAEQSGSRGNFSFVTINLPKLAIEAKGDIEKFFELFDKYIQISHDYLLFRLKTIEEKHVYNYPFLMGQGVWLGSDELKLTDSIKDVLKHASYSIGF